MSNVKQPKQQPGVPQSKPGPEMGDYIDNEVSKLCENIEDIGTPVTSGKGIAQVKFGDLFKVHSEVSNRLASVLSRARKNGFVDFKGELLMTGRDEKEIVTLLKKPPKTVQITKTQMVKTS
ncbi:Actin-binding Rho-activating protein [Fragariocoptes setiger]|uniref:Actin-binding Rho-activating protein n=1 Tax=Fragariocoptes setiger TaxID=1670756 RepID=A0ABQ7S9C2_9ACAR|nr:Actin-binding Rho-activating protein [Fragariocoptes setiger]